MSGSPSLDDLKLALADRIEDVARTLFGEPNKASVRRPEWRWGTFGSRALMVRGPKRGLFMDHEGGKGGSLLDAIMVARSCDFVGAVQWSKSYLGINGSEPTPPDPEVLREREQERAAAEAAQQTDEAKRLAYARQLWDASVSSSGTAADVYLTDARAIPRPADGWPSVVRYHPASGALIVAGTDDAGIVQFVHRVYLTVDGHKVSGSQPKLTNGLMAGAVVRLPGSASSPLLLAEGVETGLSVWVATGHEVWCSIGSISRHSPPTGRRIAVCRDDDRLQSPADLALKRALAAWQAAGHDIVVATPWAARRQDRSDFNDLIQDEAVDAVKARVQAALEPPCAPVVRHSFAEGSKILQAAMAETYQAFRAWDATKTSAENQASIDLTNAAIETEAERTERAQLKAKPKLSFTETRRLADLMSRRYIPDQVLAAEHARAELHRTRTPEAKAKAQAADKAAEPFQETAAEVRRHIRTIAQAHAEADAGPPPVHAFKVDVGGGKTELNLREIIQFLKHLRAQGDKRAGVIAVPMHALGDQQVERFEKLCGEEGLTAAVWRSRKAKVPEGEDPMCTKLDAVADAEAAMADIQRACCSRKVGGKTLNCSAYDGCRFQIEKTRKPDLWLVAHQYLVLRKPAEIGEPAFLAVDESAWAASLFGHDSKEPFGDGDHFCLKLQTLASESHSIPGDFIATERLRTLRAVAFEALSKIITDAGDIEPNQALRPLRSDILNLGIDAGSAMEADRLEWRRKTEADIWPGMPAKQRKEAVRAVAHNKIIAKLSKLWRALAQIAGPAGPERSGFIELGMATSATGTAHAVRVKGHKPISDGWKIPTILLDATMKVDLVRQIWPQAELKADIRLAMPHQHITQVVDRAYSKAQLAKPAALRDVHAIICRHARRYNGRVLVVTQKDVEERLKALGNLPGNIELAHHNDVAGKDQWGPGHEREGVAFLILIGRTEPSPYAVENMTEALTGAAIDRITPGQWYEKSDAVREMTEGTFRPAKSARHPNPIAEAIRWEITEGQLVQIIGRPRGVHRTADNPVDILAMVNTPLPFPVERLISCKDLDPSPDDLMMAAGGVSFETPPMLQRRIPTFGIPVRQRQSPLPASQRGWQHPVIRDFLLRNVANLPLKPPISGKEPAAPQQLLMWISASFRTQKPGSPTDWDPSPSLS